MILSALISIMLQSGPGAVVQPPPQGQIVAKRRKKRRKRRKKRRRRTKAKPKAEAHVSPAAAEATPAKAAPNPPEPVVEEQEQNLPGVAALDLQAVKGVDDSVAQLLNDAILTRLRASGHICADGRLRFRGGSQNHDTDCAGPAITDDAWHLVTYSYDGAGGLTLFVDAEEVQAATIGHLSTAVWGSGAVAPRIGHGFPAGSGSNLRIDEFRFYQRVMDQAEVARIFALENPAP